MPADNESFRIVFRYEKTTKNTFKYSEVPEQGQPPRIGSLYVQKWALGSDNPPRQIAVTLEPSAENSAGQGGGS